MPTPSRKAVAGSLAALAALIALARWHTYHEPFERDIAGYALMGDGFWHGRSLYSDFWDQKPPGTHLTYALATGVAGCGEGAIYLLAVAAAWVTLLGVYAAGAAGGRGARVGLCAAAFWTAICGDLYLQANQPNTEVFINACAIWAFVLLLRMSGETFEVRRVALLGALFALLSFYKHHLVLYGAVFGLAHAAFPPGESPDRRRRACVQVLALALPGALAWSGLFLYYAARGHFQIVWDSLVTFNRHYSSDPLRNVLQGASLDASLHWRMDSCLPLTAVALAGGALYLLRGPARERVLLAAWVLATFLAFALPGKFFAHYYQLWLPPLAVVGAWGLAVLDARFAAPRPRFLPLAGGALFLVLAGIQARYFRLSAEDWSRAKYGGLFVGVKRDALEAGRLLLPDETLYQTGSEPGFYFYAERRPATGVLWTYWFLEGPMAETLERRARADLARDPPELVAVCRETTPPGHPLLVELLAKYRELPGNELRPSARFFCRAGGALEARLHAEGKLE